MDKTSTNWKACSVRMVILDPKFSPKSYIVPQFSVSPKHVSSFANLHFKSIECNLFIVIMDQSFLLSEPCCKSFLKEKKRQMDRLFRVALFVVSRNFYWKHSLLDKTKWNCFIENLAKCHDAVTFHKTPPTLSTKVKEHTLWGVILCFQLWLSSVFLKPLCLKFVIKVTVRVTLNSLKLKARFT